MKNNLGALKVGRTLLKESDPLAKYYSNTYMIKRRKVLKETVDAFINRSSLVNFNHDAMINLSRWKKERSIEIPSSKVQVFQGDWGEVVYALTKKYGSCFAVLNMANAYVPGGGYVEGMAAPFAKVFKEDL